MTASTVDRLRAAAQRVHVRGLKPFDRYAHQIRPDGWTGGTWWLLSGGRDSGKTYTGAREMIEHVLFDPPCFPGSSTPHRMVIVAPTLDSAREAAVWGPSGLVDLLPGRVTLVGGEKGKKVRFDTGAECLLVSGATRRDAHALRGPGSNRCFAWVDEGAYVPQLPYVMEQLDHGLREGAARGIMSTTPRQRRAFWRWASQPTVLSTQGSTLDNLARASTETGRRRHARLVEKYGDSQRGRQELYGIIDGPVEGALFELEWIDAHRLLVPPSVRGRVAVAVDPSAGAHDLTGLIAAAELHDCDCESSAPLPHFCIVDDASKRESIPRAMRRVARFARWWEADEIVFETNGIGGQAVETLELVDPTLPIVRVNAEESKELRADPVALLYEEGRCHHLQTFDDLEDEMTTWVPPSRRTDDQADEAEADESPDRLDAAVYAVRLLAGIEQGSDAGWDI